MNNHQITLNGISGLLGSSVAVITSFQEQLDFYIRISAALTGLIVGLISIYRLIANKTKP